MERNFLLRALAWPGRHELGTLLAIGGVAAGVWLFAALADEVMEGGTRKLDSALLLALRRPGDLQPLGPPALLDAARDITALGGPVVLTLLTAAVSLFLALDGKKHMALFVCGSVGSGLLVSNLLKDSFDRPRPDIVPHEVYAASYSFPSGHSMLSAITYLTLGAILARSHERKLLKAYFLLLAVFLSGLIGVTRVYLGVHWPTDVLAGWTAGAVWALLCWLLARWLQSRSTLEPEADH
jgi:undecaprenyl-diphosphatase